jgi:ribosomal protein S18 acetylase RimI-like enzyme
MDAELRDYTVCAPSDHIMENLQLKRLSTCSFQTALEVWNEGFQGYFVDMTLSLDKFLARMSSEAISLEHSLVAFAQDKPVGFLLNGIRNDEGKKIAWNGGTGVIPSFRGQGVGKFLVNAAIDLYVSEAVDVATLEAISNNDIAIGLYKQCGYEIADELTFLQSDDPSADCLSQTDSVSYSVDSVAPAVVGSLSFYSDLSAWQTQWQSLALSCGDALIVRDSAGGAVGYALFKTKFDNGGSPSNIALYQCEVAPNRDDFENIAAAMLRRVFFSEPGKYRRTTYNFRKSNKLVIDMLMKSGFATFIEQVLMLRSMGR